MCTCLQRSLFCVAIKVFKGSSSFLAPPYTVTVRVLLQFCSHFSEIKSNQIKSLLLSHHHSTSALVSEILESVLQTVQKKKHIDSTYLQTVQKTMCKKTTYIYSVHTVYYKDILRYQYTLYTVYTHSTLCTHLYIVICEGQQIVVQRCNRLYICNVVDVHYRESSERR